MVLENNVLFIVKKVKSYQEQYNLKGIDNNRLKQQRDAMMATIPAMASQGGGTSMPVINNSYSYQNTENTVREMPTTSSLNMMTALA